jgi:glycolate oxidase FAD binding subunit
VKQRITEVNKTLSDHQIDSNIELDQPQSEQLWQRLINLPWGSSEPPDFSIKFNSVPSDVASIMGLLDKTDLQHIVHGVIADFGLGTLRSLLWSNGNSAIDRPSFEAITLQVTQVGSRWVLERSPLQFKKEIDIWGIEPEGLPIMQRIKNRFDPKDIFNPGRFVSGL